ncbi:Rieske (2Fe-2S) protein [Burkholderia sp. Ax-1719]|uniref:Rieske 2Fe-2S domain-containing protein n=1 Tax=Burkholderia sp. Ax-1719 TaxID=2608334 RepID=UPI00141EA30D|nr:Rieske (2Fe-2S) protein [Burkholderia sp. Ax-1719]
MYLTDLDALPQPCSRGFDPHGAGQATLFVVHHASGVRAWRDACPHYGDTPMAWRKDAWLDAGGRHIVCHAHGALFDIESGVCIKGPCLGQRLTPVPLHIDKDGRVFVHDPTPQQQDQETST